MVLISIQPFALRKIFLVIVALLCFSTLCFADPVLMVQRYGSSSSKACDEPRVDLPARSQDLLPGKFASPEQAFCPGDIRLPGLAISAGFAYT
jgi:hypothetical protein